MDQNIPYYPCMPYYQAPQSGTGSMPSNLMPETPAMTPSSPSSPSIAPGTNAGNNFPSQLPNLTSPGTRQGPPVFDPGYVQGFLARNIGRRVRISFLIGTNSFVDKSGKILEVGINYVLLREAETDDQLMCDLYSIKFVNIYM